MRSHSTPRYSRLQTTHDVELQHLLGVQFELFHFQENPAVEGFFDHELHSGASTQRNAIRVLERLGYPASMIAEALATVVAIDAPKMPSGDMAPPSRNPSHP